MGNDVHIIAGITIFFLILGFALPFIHASFNEDQSTVNTEGLEEEIGQDDVSASDVALSMFTMFFWTFGNIPLWLDATLFTGIRIVFAILVYRLIRSGGG